MKLPKKNPKLLNLKDMFGNQQQSLHHRQVTSPYPIDGMGNGEQALESLRGRSILVDGLFKGDYSLAIVNRQLVHAMIEAGLNVRVHTGETDWKSDPMLNEMSDVRARCLDAYPAPESYDIHLRNTWPPTANNMVGRLINAYVCFAWEELNFPQGITNHFNAHIDLVMVTANFVTESLVRSGVRVPVINVGNGTDHVLKVTPQKLPASLQRGETARILHVSSCFPRKGADVLVDAFCRTFSKEENVELFIKTFENPHNAIDKIVAKAKATYPGAAPIRVVKQSLSAGELVELVRTATLLVAPSRGEGFGLPLAEATLLAVPVVTTNFSGQTDFCTEETAWLVDYQLEASSAHVTANGGVWAEPDVTSLGRQMRAALENTTEARDKVRKGQALLSNHFRWSDVVQRIALSVADLEGRCRVVPSQANIMPAIDLVSTWNQVCGIATYSEHLFSTEALAPALRQVMAREIRGDGLAAPPTTERVKVTRPWAYEAAGIARLAADIQAGMGNILWFQHHPGFFADGDMEALVNAMQQSRHDVRVITLHNVRDTIENGRGRWLDVFDTVFVHTEDDLRMLADQRGLIATLIPHGILETVPRFSTSRGFTIGTFGFLYPHKNVPMLVEAVALARTVVPDLRLSITTSVRRDPVSMIERARVEKLIDELDLAAAVDADFRFLDDQVIFDRLSECDLLCFPYGPSTESATGAARIALSVDRPILCSRSSVLTDILPYSIVQQKTDVQHLAEALILLAASSDLLHIRDRARREFVACNTYDAVARRYAKTIHHLLKGASDAE